MSEYVYSMYRADKFYGPDRQVLANISLSFFHGAKIGVLGPNGVGQVDAAADHGGARGDLERRGAARAGRDRRAARAGAGARPGQGRARQRRGRRPRAARPARPLQRDLRRLRRARRRLRRAPRRAGEGAGRDRPPRRLVARRDARPGDGRAAAPRRRPRRRRRSRAASAAASRSAACCSQAPDLLLLDEPTNHLDAESVDWLERFLADYKGAVIAVTHDRYFLDNVAGWILELDRGRGIPFQGNYSSWLEQKQARLAVEEKQESARRRTLARELEWVRMSPRARHAKSKARLGAYEKLLAEEQRRQARPGRDPHPARPAPRRRS